MSANNSISARTQRLNKLIVSCSDESNNADESSSVALNREILLDAFDVLYNDCQKDPTKKSDQNVYDFTKKYRGTVSEMKGLRVNINDFTMKDVIGRGHFGEVFLAKEKITNDAYAIKKMPKSTFAQSKEERNILAVSHSDWIPSLQYAFQDQANLYLVMEYLPGGDLFSLMTRNHPFTEDNVQFYLAEITLALNALHTLGFVHRDIKPENVLLDRLGHLKLADFGSAAVIEKSGHVTSFTPIGTPDYIAPELLQPIHSKRPMKTTYNETCDFWSMGIIAYEMLTESTPFSSDNVHDTYARILAYADSTSIPRLDYPADIEVSKDLRDLIDRLVTGMDSRLTYKKIVTHRFFRGIDWMSIRQQVPPIIPILDGEDDTTNFKEDARKSRRDNTFDASPSSAPTFTGSNLPFVGYGFVHEQLTSDGMIAASETSRGEVCRLTSQVKNLQKTIDVQMGDIGSLQQNLSHYQRKNAQMGSVEKILTVTRDELNTLKEKLKEKTAEVANARTQIKTLKNSLQIVEDERVKNDKTISATVELAYQKWERAKKESEHTYEKRISEKNAEVLTIQHKLRLCQQELDMKSAECQNLQETVDNFKDRLKSSKCQSNTEKTEYARKHRESNVHFEGQLRDLRDKLQRQTDAKHNADDELQSLREKVDETSQRLKLVAEQKEKLDRANTELTNKLSKEIDENLSIQAEKNRAVQQIQELQNRIDELSSDVRRRSRMSTAGDSIEGSASVYCSLESLTSDIEQQLKKDLVMAKESESEQRARANSLEESVKRLEAVIERLNKHNMSGVEVLLERKNEKLEERLCTVQEQATVERQASRSAHLALWKLEKELESVNRDKDRLQQALKKAEIEKDAFDRKNRDENVALRAREDRIKELQGDLTVLKAEMRTERSRWETVEKERNKDKTQIVNLNTKIHKLEIDLDECRSKLRLLEQQKTALTVDNKQLTQKMRRVEEELSTVAASNDAVQQEHDTLTKNCEMLKNVCTLMETQLNELEDMYNAQIQQNKEKTTTIDKLWEDIRERDGKLLKIQQELREEKVQRQSGDHKSSEMTAEMATLTASLAECQMRIAEMHQELMDKTDKLMKAEELLEVQREELQNYQRINTAFDREVLLIKEENSKLLTELYMSKEANQKQNNEYANLQDNHNDLKKELNELSRTMCEVKTYNVQREIKSEATQAQYDKLIDFLQKRVDELTQKKKKTLAEVLFGANGNGATKKENVPPPTKEAQTELKRDRSRSSRTQPKLSKSQSTKSAVAKIDEKIHRSASKISAKLANVTKPKPDSEAVAMEVHQFEKTSWSNDGDTCAQCQVCKKYFTDDTIYQCKKCKMGVHQYCRGGNTPKCTVGKMFGAGDDDVSVDVPLAGRAQPMARHEKPEYCGDVVLRESDSVPAITVHCIQEMDDGILLLGCSSGLKSFNTHTNKLMHVANIEHVINIAISPLSQKALLISENGRKLLQCDVRQLQSRAKASVCLNTGLEYIELDLQEKFNDQWRFARIYDNTEQSCEMDEPIAIVAAQTQIAVLRYNIGFKHFQAITIMDSAEPVRSIHFTATTAIVSSDKYFEIDLKSLQPDEFLDMSDPTLSHTTKSRPFDVFAVTGQEYLVCFEDFGVFVDKCGFRTRPHDVKWTTCSPVAFAYRAPILYVLSSDAVQMIRVHKSYTNELETDAESNAVHDALQTVIGAHNVRFGAPYGKYGVYVLSTARDEPKRDGNQQIVRIDGTKALRNTLNDSMETILSDDTEY